MLNCFCHNDTQPSIPIIALSESQLPEWLAQQDAVTANWVRAVGFTAKTATTAFLSNPQGELTTVLLGLGAKTDLTSLAQGVHLPAGVYHLSGEWTPEHAYQAALSWGLASYQYTLYKKTPPLTAKLQMPAGIDSLYLEAILRGTYLVRDLINTPADDMTPADLAEVAHSLVGEFGGVVRQIIGDALLVENYPAIHAVGRASVHSPQLIDLRWGKPDHPKVTLVGKGVCFDSGGLDLKNASGMATMKKDMAGAAHVLALARCVMALQLPICLRVLIPAVENVVSSNAYHPGDILKTRRGLSIEVTNTDAEGRLILCDALTEAVSEHPDLLIDFASLTGAARVALGTDISALFTPDNHLALQLMQASEAEHDPLWRLPLYAPYRKLLDSKIADLANAASAPYGGAITAAIFLQEFIPQEQLWAHFDIMAWNTSSKPAAPEGGEASALRAVFHYLYHCFKGSL